MTESGRRGASRENFDGEHRRMGHFPRGNRHTGLEKNILKYRAFEMILILHHVQHLRRFVIDSIRATDRLVEGPDRLPSGIARPDKKAWRILVQDGVLTDEESREIQELIDYRNIIAHATEEVTVSLNRTWNRFRVHDRDTYDREALKRLDMLRHKIYSGMASTYVLTLDHRPLMFEAAEEVYREELGRLRTRIRKQVRSLQAEIDRVNKNIASLPHGLLKQLEPSHPRHRNRNGTLSNAGVQFCYALFQEGTTPLAVAYLMRLSLRSSKARFTQWKIEGNSRRS